MKYTMALLSIFLLFGCVTGPDEKKHLDPKLVASIAGEATRLGSLSVLAIHPEYRPQFQQARQAAQVLLSIGSFDIGQLTAILGNLPIAEGQQGQVGIIVGQGFITLWGLYGEYVMTLDKGAAYETWVKPVAIAIEAGLGQALGMPAKPLPQLPH